MGERMNNGVFVQDQDKLTSDVESVLFPKRKFPKRKRKDRFLEEFKARQKKIIKKIFGE